MSSEKTWVELRVLIEKTSCGSAFMATIVGNKRELDEEFKEDVWDSWQINLDSLMNNKDWEEDYKRLKNEQ